MEEMLNEINQYVEYLTEADSTAWPVADQLAIFQAQIEMVEKIKPILLKHMMTDEQSPKKSTFMFRVKGSDD
jgi:hypothetical protein